jgi:hypothetical protein
LLKLKEIKMADAKISALTGATTPLAGTEVLPIVQGGTTVKVAVSNLTAGRAVAVSSLASSGNIGAVNTAPTTPLMVNTYNGSDPTYRGDVVVNSPGASLSSNGGIELKVDNAGSGFGARFLNYYPGSGSTYDIAIQMRNNSASWTTQLNIKATGNVSVSTGNLVIDTSGKGITLPGGITWTSGAGSPEGVVTAPVGSLYSRSDGGLLSSLYVKESGSGNTGWAGK